MNRLFICDRKENLLACYTKEQVGSSALISTTEFMSAPGAYAHIEAIFSTWGMPAFTLDELKTWLPNLKAVFYGAGSIIGFASPFFEAGVRIYSAWASNAVPVAEYAAAQIILANKGFFQLHGRYRMGHEGAVGYAQTFPGNYRTKVGLLGFGMISRKIIELLQPYELDLHVWSKHLTEEEADRMRVRKADMAYIFSECQTISNHLANKPENVGILNDALFSGMKRNATFINTGRGAQVDEAALIRAMRSAPDRTAVLDVTDPKEPMPVADEIWQVPNIILTPHRAGSTTEEIHRMGAAMLDAYDAYVRGEACRAEVTEMMLRTMA